MNSQAKIGLIILAAGASERFGAPKQLLCFRGETLLRRIAREAIESVCQPIVLVFGKDAEKFAEHLEEFDVFNARSDDWQEGMGNSISTGIEKLLEIDEEIDGAVLAVCDQPFVTSKIINRLVGNFYQCEALIVASAYSDTLGVPVLFSRRLFPELTALKGRGGAKEVIARFSNQVVAVDFPEGAFDIDTPEDFRQLEENK
jgi:molybdenum cofactor cytidylyltransferase